MMPDLDGWAFRAEQLATPALADVPVIVLSAARNRQAEALGSAAVVPKLFHLERLLNTVTNIVG
jgi:CheY-like chemotaxis protein